MKDILITSGFIQISLAVMLGWVLVMLYTGKEAVGPFRHAKRVLQGHIDYILMALLQFAIAAIHPAIPEIAGWLVVVGSWTNASLFLVLASLKDPKAMPKWFTNVSTLSFLTLTIGYPWLLYAWLTAN